MANNIQFEKMNSNKRQRIGEYQFEKTTYVSSDFLKERDEYISNFFDDFRYRETQSLQSSDFDTISVFSSDTELYISSEDDSVSTYSDNESVYNTVSPENVIRTPPRLFLEKIKKD